MTAPDSISARIAGLLLALALLAACAGTRPAPAVPAETGALAEVPGFPAIRAWGDVAPPDLAQRMSVFLTQLRARAATEGGLPNGGRMDALILSGGGADGAFGAGLLNGWTERGDRPDFTFVTGISAGALLAPLAFLGPEHDAELRRFSVESDTDSIIELTPLSGIVNGYGLSDSAPLRRQIRRVITPEIVAGIAAEHARGRRLWIGTTNLDAQRPVIWDIGAIATTGGEPARELIVDVILASASIPVAFPPVMLPVEVAGARYSEMHVDGGVTQQLFFYPGGTRLPLLPDDLRGMVERGTLYVVRNGKLDAEWQEVSPGLASIAERAIMTLTKVGGRHDISRIETQAGLDGFGLAVTAMPADFVVEQEETFDPKYMAALFETARRMVLDRKAWSERHPPRATRGARP